MFPLSKKSSSFSPIIILYKMKKIFFIVFILLPFHLFTQNSKAIYDAYIFKNIHKWQRTIDTMEKLKKNKTDLEWLELINYQYGYIAWCISEKKHTEAEIYLKKAENNLTILLKKNYNLSMLYAYKAAFIGFSIGISFYKAPFIGGKSYEYAEKALKLSPKNAFAYQQLGNIKFYSPKIFGGSKNEALTNYLKALQIMEKTPSNLNNNWNYINLLSNIAMTYKKLGNNSMQKKYYQKIQRLVPQCKWIKDLYATDKEK